MNLFSILLSCELASKCIFDYRLINWVVQTRESNPSTIEREGKKIMFRSNYYPPLSKEQRYHVRLMLRDWVQLGVVYGVGRLLLYGGRSWCGEEKVHNYVCFSICFIYSEYFRVHHCFPGRTPSLDLNHSQVWNLPHKFHLYLILRLNLHYCNFLRD